MSNDLLSAAERLAIAELVYRYAWASDGRDFEALAACFVEDGEVLLDNGGAADPITIRGHRVIADWVRDRHAAEFARGDRRRHMTTCLVVEAEAADRALARSYVQVVVADAAGGLRVAAMGWYRDEVCRQAGEWRFVRRAIRIEGRG